MTDIEPPRTEHYAWAAWYRRNHMTPSQYEMDVIDDGDLERRQWDEDQADAQLFRDMDR